MTSATEVLRRLLNERGVEYDTDDEDGCEFTEWVANGLEWEADSRGELVSLMPVMLITPEQAIAATLGTGTCKVDVLNTGDCAGYECSEYIMHCNGCGHEFGHVLYNEDGDVWMSEPPKYCPNCGRRIVEPTTNDVGAEVGDD